MVEVNIHRMEIRDLRFAEDVEFGLASGDTKWTAGVTVSRF